MEDTIVSLFELAWRTTQQISVSYDKDCNRIKCYGSGFFLCYSNILFFITANHVTNPEDFEEGIRLGKDDFVWIINNKNDYSK